MKNIEIEMKYKITKEIYDEIISYFKINKFKEKVEKQNDIYFSPKHFPFLGGEIDNECLRLRILDSKNILSYKKFVKATSDEPAHCIEHELEVSDIVAIIQATGTGKDHNALQYAYDNKDKRGLFLVPSIGIIEHCGEIINNIPSVDLKRDFANLRFITYHSLVNMSYE